MLLSCSKEPEKKKVSTKGKDSYVRDGTTRLYYSDGKLRAEISMKGGLRNGIAKEYYNNGQVHLIINYKDSKNHGITKRYFDNGDMMEETSYWEGEMHGPRTRYRKGGSLYSVASYHHGEPCVGLKEYKTDSTLVTGYPSIIVKEINRLKRDGEFVVQLKMSNGTKKATFYRGSLSTMDCINEQCTEIPATAEHGIGELVIRVPKGLMVKDDLLFVAKVKTNMGNYFVTTVRHPLAIINR